VGVGVDSRRDADEDPADACLRRPADLVERVQDDEAGSGLGRRAELFVALVVSMDDDALSRDSRAQGEAELAES
jgi:hypothetical protein